MYELLKILQESDELIKEQNKTKTSQLASET